MATVANALKNTTAAEMAGIKKAAQAMGTTAFELAAGGTFANFIPIMNSLIGVKTGVTPSDTAADTIPVGPIQALRSFTAFRSLVAFRNVVADCDATEFDALTGDTQANVLLWLDDVISIWKYNSDIASSYAGWGEAL